MQMIKMSVGIASATLMVLASGYVAPATAVAQTENAGEAPASDYRSETVDGVAWRYYISEGKAVLEAPYKEKRADSQMRFRWSVIDSKTAGSVKIPEKLGGVAVGRIGQEAFSCCTNLVSITIPNGVESIGGAAFYACKALKSITIPSSVKSVEQKAFAHCWRLEEVVIEPGLENIGWEAFIGCPRLSCVRLPSSVREIGKNVKLGRGMPPFRVFEPMCGPKSSPTGMPSLCDELTFVVDKGDEDRIRGMFFDKLYEKWQELKKKRGLPDRAIKVMPEDEYRRLKDSPPMRQPGMGMR